MEGYFFLMVNAIASQWAKGLSQSGLWIPITSCQPRPFHSFLFCSRIFAVFAASSWPWGWEVERTDLWKQKVGRAAMFRLEEWLLKYKIETVLLGRAGRGLVNGVPLTVTPLHNPPMAKGVGIHSCLLVSDHCNCAEKSKGLYSRTGFRRG